LSVGHEIDKQTKPLEMNMNAFKKILVTVAAAATLGGAALTSTQASACGDYGYSSYSYSPSYSYDSYGYDSYGYSSYGYDHNDRREFRGHDRRR
jgi:hypothetical protein